MKTLIQKSINRRIFIKNASSATAGLIFLPGLANAHQRSSGLFKRPFGAMDFEVTTFGLGGQASLQWTPEDIDPVQIILKSFDEGVNYFDTSNLYGPSQLNFGAAFKKLHLLPGQSGYDEALRRSIFLTSKTHLRWGAGHPERAGVTNWSNGGDGGNTADDIRRSLTQIFGDGKGGYPKGAYLDMMLIHNLNTIEEVDALYTGLENTVPDLEEIGALAVLRDFRDGSNLTGQNPREEKLIRHIGFSGHYSAPVMMEMIRRDSGGILDGMLVSINANDRLNLNMQHNVIPVAEKRRMGIIAMKVFADGAMYAKEPRWSRTPDDVVRSVGSPDLPSKPLIEYALSTPGISTAIVGIGQISNKRSECQLTQNIAAAQIEPDGMSASDREEVEMMTARIREGKTNYFQIAEGKLSPPNNVRARQITAAGQPAVDISWDSAYAGREPIEHYEIISGGSLLGKLQHSPQIDKMPFTFTASSGSDHKREFTIAAVDRSGQRAETRLVVEN